MNIVTRYLHPPIPERAFDWCAFDDSNYCGCPECTPLMGYGATREEAISDFLTQLGERRETTLELTDRVIMHNARKRQ